MKLKITDDLKKEFPYTCEYFEMYGKKSGKNIYELDDLPESTVGLPPKYKGRMELLFKECIQTGKQWNDIIKEPKSNDVIY